VELPQWIEQLWGELRFKELVGHENGLGFQRLFQQVMKAVDGDDFLEIRPVGKHGDFKCDGWGMQSRTCYAVYGPFTRQSLASVRRKLANDFHGAVSAWPDMRAWRLVHNDIAGLGAVVAAALVSLHEEASTKASHITILPPWGPNDLSWLLWRAPAEARVSILGTHGWRVTADRQAEFSGVNDDPVSISAGRSVAQLLDSFAGGGIVDPLPATAFAGTLAAFLLGNGTAFEKWSSLLEQRCRDDPFETMLSSIVFCVKAIRLWEAATGDAVQLLVEMWLASDITISYVTEIVMSALHGTEDCSLPGHPDDQQKVTMNLGQLIALTLGWTADHRSDPLVVVLQDLLISVQREPAKH
jgi:hypothetical protein